MICIYGAGKVGQWVAKLCEALDMKYDLVDDTSNTPENFDSYTFIVPSPGIPPSHRLWNEWAKIMGELDFAYAHMPKWSFRFFSVTGTDGKSTTSLALHAMLSYKFDYPVYLTGNFDEPLSAIVADIIHQWITQADFVVEVSSFMAYRLSTYSSDATIVTNLVQDHLDWHADKDDYFRSKFRLVQQTVWPVTLLESTHKQEQKMFDEWRGEYVPTNAWWAIENYVDESDGVVLTWGSKIECDDHNFTGPYNAQNILHAAIVAQNAWVSVEDVRLSLKGVTWIEHRQEFVTEINGVKFINDSKSTSGLSQRAALEWQEDGGVVLIMWGKDKGDRFNGFNKLWKAKCKHVLLIGQMADYLAERLDEIGVSYSRIWDMTEAVTEGMKYSSTGDVVLLAPWCASLDMFPSYMKRGDLFKEAARAYMT